MLLWIIMLIVPHEKRETFPPSGVKILDDICKWNQAIKVLSLPSCSALFPRRQCDVTSGLSAFRDYLADRWQRYCCCLTINLHNRLGNDLFVRIAAEIWSCRNPSEILLNWLLIWQNILLKKKYVDKELWIR